jgi:hypothetical protein
VYPKPESHYEAQRPYSTFITPVVKSLLKKRYLLRKTGQLDKANQLAEKINLLIGDAARSSYADLSLSKPTTLWRTINSKPNINSSLAVADPNVFNRFFASNSYCPSKQDCFDCDSTLNLADDTLSAVCNEFEIAKKLSTVANTSPGLDGLPAWVFRNCAVELAGLVTCIFNQSIVTGTVPNSWCTAIVTPVPKIKKPEVVSDYRPISVTPILSRVLEGIVVKKYLQPSLDINLIRDQFAYKTTGSTTCALVDLLHCVTRSLETCKYVRCLLVDFAKAFDTVDRSLLLDKLTKLDIPININKWVAKFLSNRFQMVACNGVRSSILPVNQGVVQGSALGPTLFTIMISDLKPVSNHNELVKFADDLTLLVPETSDTDVVDEFNSIQNWANMNKLTINFSKTKEIVFHRPKPGKLIFPPPLQGIERVLIAKLLGVTLSSSLSFSEHVDCIIKQCGQRSFLLRSLRRRGLKAAPLEAVFSALIINRILYAVSAWGGFINATERGRIDAFLLRSKRFGHCNKVVIFEQLLEKADRKLFRKIQSKNHCINHLLPAARSTAHVLRERGHPYVLPSCTFSLYKRSFINRMLFEQM